ncbi:26S proteasome non-ATPase regulatory subunit 11 [Pelomyxa schiedti]|nr:26S proteasome non-ATPase regulatory subunit 11 [Pelomyxa schiedti]
MMQVDSAAPETRSGPCGPTAGDVLAKVTGRPRADVEAVLAAQVTEESLRQLRPDWSSVTVAQLEADVATLPPDVAAAVFFCVISAPLSDVNGQLEAKEHSIYQLAEMYSKTGRGTELIGLLQKTIPVFASISKAKTAKIVRTMLDKVAGVQGSEHLQIMLCKECIAWTNETKRTYLRQRLQLSLYSLYLATKDYHAALTGLQSLLKEVKRLDDKPLLMEIQLLESRIHRALRNIPKAKAALTSARTNANAIYCPPKLQIELDIQTGTINADERDYNTAFSYFFEAFEGYLSVNEREKATFPLKYMLLCKVMTASLEDVHGIINSKSAQAFLGHPVVNAMQTIAKARAERKLHDFTAARATFKRELDDDPIVCPHLDELYKRLLEQNLCRIIEPFSCVEIAHVAHLINLPLEVVEKRLSQMILDKKIEGILDQGAGTLILFDDPPTDKTYPIALEAMQSLGHIVDSLYEKSTKLMS